MTEDAKAARDRRLAEALRANLKRRKTAARAAEARAPQTIEHPPTERQDAEGDSRG